METRTRKHSRATVPSGEESRGNHSVWMMGAEAVVAVALGAVATPLFVPLVTPLVRYLRYGPCDGHGQIVPVSCVVIASFILGYLSIRHSSRCRQNWLRWCLRAAALLLLSCVLIGLYYIYLYNRFLHNETTLRAKIPRLKWIAYESPHLDRSFDKAPTTAEVEDELRHLHQAGFNGVITFSGEGGQSEAAAIAKRVGFQGVILGILPPQSLAESMGGDQSLVELQQEAELRRVYQAAIAQSPSVDGYCVGHDAYPIADLKWLWGKMNAIRRETQKPVTTTFQLGNYTGCGRDQVTRLGDWLFPDVHADWPLQEISPSRAVEQTKSACRGLRELSLMLGGKPVLLKMISYPSGGGNGNARFYSPDKQLDFYRLLIRWQLSGDFDSSVGISLFSAYDLPWKRSEDGWSTTEEHVGLYEHHEGNMKGMVHYPQKKAADWLSGVFEPKRATDD